MFSLANIIVIMFFLILIHFVYWSTIAPTWRLDLRHKGFIIRDKIHSLKIEENSREENLMLDMMEKSVSHVMGRMTDINISSMYKARLAQEDEEFKKSVEIYEVMIANCNKEIKNVDKEIAMLTREAFVSNAMIHIAFLFPLVVATFAIEGLWCTLTGQIRKLSRVFELMSEKKYQEHHLHTPANPTMAVA